MSFITSILEQGLIYGILALGIYITYKILDFPDLTVDGSFPLGAAITAALLTRGMNPYITLILSFLAGAVAGICTGLIHVKCKVRDLLSGIIMMTALWTINLYIAGTANVPLFSQKTIFKNDLMDKIIPDALAPYSTLIIILVLAVICKVLLDLYLNTKSGFLLRAVGDNDVLVVSLAKDKGNIKILGLAISNGLVALAGCVFAQEERVFEINSFILALSSERSFICIRPSTDTTSITLTGSDSRKAIVSFMASFAVQLSIFTSKTLIFSFISSPANSFPSFSIIANGYSLFNLYYTIFTLINIRNTFVIFFIFPFLFRDQPSDSTGFLGCK